MLEVKFYDSVDDSLLKFAVIVSQSNGKFRRSHAKEVADAGFDSKTEAEKMLQYYLNALKG